MRFKSILFILLICIAPCLTHAQHAMIGFGTDLIHQKGHLLSVTASTTNGNYLHKNDTINKILIAPTFYFNLALPIYTINDFNSLNFMFGLETFASISSKYKTINQFAGTANYGKASTMVMGAQIPLYLCYVKGPKATKESKKKSGYMFGWGLNYTLYQTPTDKASFLSPAIIVEWRFSESIAMRMEYLTRRHVTQYDTYTGFVPRLSSRFFQFSLNYNMSLGAKYKTLPIDKSIVRKKPGSK
jgi:hypothetical protein